MINLKSIKEILFYFKDYKKNLIFATILIVISSIIDLSYGYLNGAAIEAITNLQLKKSIIYLLIYLVISIISSGIIKRCGSFLMIKKAEIKISGKLKTDIQKKVLDLPAYAFEEKSSGEIINRITSDTGVLANTFDQLLYMIVNILGSIIVLIYILFNSYVMFFEIIFFIIIMIILVKIYNPKLKKVDKEIKEEVDKGILLVNESVKGIREIKVLGIKERIMYNTKNLMDRFIDKQYKELKTETIYDLLTNILKSFLEVGVFITCAILVYQQKITLTFFIAMTYYVYRYTWIVENFTNFSKNYQKVVVSLGRINEIINNELYQDEQFGNKKIDNVEGIIEFKDVTFSYPNEGEILKNFNIKLDPNKKIAIVGKSGQGKSTLFNLITKIFLPKSGKILIDGVDINELEENNLRIIVSIIRQEPFLFNKTIKENFTEINPNITLDEIRKYAKMAYIDSYIMSLPKKYDTQLGEGGINLSGGQKQRIAIARSLMKKSKIILFDEATSALDNESQNYIKKSIDDLSKDHTIVIIAHRLSTIVDADIIYVIDDGKVINSGNHKYLMKNCGYYKELYYLEENN